MRRAHILPVAMLGLALLTTAGCRPGYVLRVGVQHLKYVSRARPISEAIAEADAEGELERRDRLQLVLDVRAFAEARGLNVGGSYLQVSDTTGLATAYVVTAAYADRLEPYEWSYPIVGRIPYRGYFERSEADEFARQLESEGLDTYVVEASGYSTLGWFDDPLPSGLLELDPVTLADVVLHELVHQTVYVPGRIEFNETLATAVAARMTIEFFEQRGQPESVERARDGRRRWLQQSAITDALAERLREYFAESRAKDREALLAGRASIYAQAWQELAEAGLVRPRRRIETEGSDSVDDPGAAAMNNASFLAIYRYRRRGGDIDAYIGGFASISQALQELEAALADRADPYEIVASRAARPPALLRPVVACTISPIRRAGAA